MKKPMILIVFAVLLLMNLAACSGSASGSLEGREWKLVSINGKEALAGSTVTATFEDGRVGGSGGCNSYGGEYRLDGEQLTIGQVVQTEMACMEPAGVMEQETAYGQALSQAASYRMNDEQLEILNADGEVILSFQ